MMQHAFKPVMTFLSRAGVLTLGVFFLFAQETQSQTTAENALNSVDIVEELKAELAPLWMIPKDQTFQTIYRYRTYKNIQLPEGEYSRENDESFSSHQPFPSNQLLSDQRPDYAATIQIMRIPDGQIFMQSKHRIPKAIIDESSSDPMTKESALLIGQHYWDGANGFHQSLLSDFNDLQKPPKKMGPVYRRNYFFSPDILNQAFPLPLLFNGLNSLFSYHGVNFNHFLNHEVKLIDFLRSPSVDETGKAIEEVSAQFWNPRYPQVKINFLYQPGEAFKLLGLKILFSQEKNFNDFDKAIYLGAHFDFSQGEWLDVEKSQIPTQMRLLIFSQDKKRGGFKYNMHYAEREMDQKIIEEQGSDLQNLTRLKKEEAIFLDDRPAIMGLQGLMTNLKSQNLENGLSPNNQSRVHLYKEDGKLKIEGQLLGPGNSTIKSERNLSQGNYVLLIWRADSSKFQSDMATLIRHYSKFRKQNVHFVMINPFDQVSKIQDFLGSYPEVKNWIHLNQQHADLTQLKEVLGLSSKDENLARYIAIINGEIVQDPIPSQYILGTE